MIDPKILDAVLPIPDLDELRDSTIQELKDEGFTITNFHSGGVFHTMLMIVLRVRIEFVELLRTVLNNMFLSHANGAWLVEWINMLKERKLLRVEQLLTQRATRLLLVLGVLMLRGIEQMLVVYMLTPEAPAQLQKEPLLLRVELQPLRLEPNLSLRDMKQLHTLENLLLVAIMSTPAEQIPLRHTKYKHCLSLEMEFQTLGLMLFVSREWEYMGREPLILPALTTLNFLSG